MLRRCWFPVAILVLAACAGGGPENTSAADPSGVATPGADSAVEVGAEDVDIEIEATVVRVGSSFEVSLTVTNTGPADVELPDSPVQPAEGDGFSLAFIARDTGDEAPPGVDAVALQAGDTIEIPAQRVRGVGDEDDVVQVCVEAVAATGGRPTGDRAAITLTFDRGEGIPQTCVDVTVA